MEEEVYIISGEHKTNLTNNSELNFTHDKNVVITDSTKSQQELKLATASMNKLVVPFGRRSNLILADGTKVFINSGTKVDFPSKFIGDKREITVNGEVYIEVKKDASKPFIIHTNSMNVEVYGTSFNISDYDDDITKTVVLVEGSIGVKTAGRETKLKPNRKLEVTNGKITEETVDVSEYICWTKGIMEFNETPVSEILKKVGRYYNVEFENSPDISLNDKTYSGKLFLSNNLDSVMVSISLLSSTKYSREDNIIHISKK
jgi:ferric-dicitrate binding protein FerR (iron transport regulator)